MGGPECHGPIRSGFSSNEEPLESKQNVPMADCVPGTVLAISYTFNPHTRDW